MDYEKLQEDFKRDLTTIPTLKMGVLSASELYGSLALFILKLSLIFLTLNMMLAALLHAVGLYYQTISVVSLVTTWGIALPFSGFICIFISQFILFGKLVKGRLKTEAFIKKKCLHFCGIYLIIYSVAYTVLIILSDSFSSSDPTYRNFFDLIFPLIFSQLGASFGSMVAMSVLVNMEVSRLGMGIAFDVINAFVARMYSNHSQQLGSNGGSVDDAR